MLRNTKPILDIGYSMFVEWLLRDFSKLLVMNFDFWETWNSQLDVRLSRHTSRGGKLLVSERASVGESGRQAVILLGIITLTVRSEQAKYSGHFRRLGLNLSFIY